MSGVATVLFLHPHQSFECIGLQTNAEKMKVMMCLLGKIRIAWTEEEYGAQQAGDATMTKRGALFAISVAPA
jgi:hypothetical protein